MEVYFDLLLIGNPQIQLNEQTKMSFASTLLTRTASNRWHIKVMSQAVPQSLDDIKVAVSIELIPFDHVRRRRDKVHKLVQHSSISKCLNEFRILIITVRDRNYGEMLDTFCAGT